MRKTNSTNYENQKKLETSCGLTYAMILLSGRWKVNILWNVKDGINRYGLLKKAIPGISEKMLTERLKDLEREGLIIRKDFQKVPPHVEYYLTEAGNLLTPILGRLCSWGTKVRPMMMELENQLITE